MLIPKKLFENVRFPDGRLYEDEAVFYKIFMVSDGAEYIPYKGYIMFNITAQLQRH